jgi:hypothetical protein
MTDITEEDQVSNPEHSTGEVAPLAEMEIINLNPVPENMEVHKHPHHVMHKKKWPEYLLEFAMLFLAVFLGFVAENIRERAVEHRKEKEYIHALFNDLKSDTTKLGNNIARYKKLLLRQDTLLNNYSFLHKGFNRIFYRNLISIQGFPDFIYTDATIQQLKNSGGFALIRNHTTIENIMIYDAVVKSELINESNQGARLEKMDDFTSEIFNKQAIDDQLNKGKSLEEIEAGKTDWLFSHDGVIMAKFYNRISVYNDLFKIVMSNMEDAKKAAIALMHYLQNEYHLE